MWTVPFSLANGNIKKITSNVLRVLACPCDSEDGLDLDDYSRLKLVSQRKDSLYCSDSKGE
jgi:uncharacterized protein YbaR (Trm112 family)